MSRKDQSDNKLKTKHSRLLMLFGFGFLLPAILLVALSIVPSIVESIQMRHWIEARASVLDASLTVSSGDSTTYKAKARYTFNVDGEQFTSERVAINGGSDNIGEFQKNLARQLMASRRTNQSVPVYYDPDNPGESVLNRDLRWELMLFSSVFVVVFGSIGIVSIFFGWRGIRVNDSVDVLSRPWLANPAWQGGEIYSDGKLMVFAWWLAAVVLNAIGWPMLLFRFRKVLDENLWVTPLLLVLPLTGLYALFKAVQAARQWLRYGQTPLQLDPFPARLGGHCRGLISVEPALSAGAAVDVRLCLLQQHTGKDNSSGEETVWEQTECATLKQSGSVTGVHFDIAIPENLPQSDTSIVARNNNDSYRWQLSVENRNGLLHRKFIVPVFRSG